MVSTIKLNVFRTSLERKCGRPGRKKNYALDCVTNIVLFYEKDVGTHWSVQKENYGIENY